MNARRSTRDLETLVAAARARLPGSIDRLVRAAQPLVAGLAGRMAANRADGEEIAQESLIVMLCNLERFEGRSRVSTWIYALVRSQVGRKYRRQRPVAARVAKTGGLDVIDVRRDADAWELREDLGVALRALSGVNRDILLGRDLEGEPAEVLACELGLSVSAVKSRLRRARLAVRDTLQDRAQFPAWPAVDSTRRRAPIERRGGSESREGLES